MSALVLWSQEEKHGDGSVIPDSYSCHDESTTAAAAVAAAMSYTVGANIAIPCVLFGFQNGLSCNAVYPESFSIPRNSDLRSVLICRGEENRITFPAQNGS